MGTNLTDDNLLVSRIRNDSLEAFELLYNRYSKKLYYFSLRYLEDNVDAEEIVQVVFISVWEHRKTLDETRSIKNYIFKSTANNIYNYLKKKAIRQKYVDYELQKPERSVNQTYDLIFYKELEKKIDTIVSSLPPQQQKIFNLSRSNGLSHEEIAKKLKLSIRTVENQIYRVIKVIKEHMKSEM
jgi:RNA polymerase sigma-70 factor (ECF subfamily)